MMVDILMYEDPTLFDTALKLLFRYAFRTQHVLES